MSGGGKVPMRRTTAAELVAELPAVFTYAEARAAGLSSKQLGRLRNDGVLESVGRGVYRRGDASWHGDIDLIEIAFRAPDATLCLATALARHGLTDLIPATIDVALPRGQWKPVVRAPVTWHAFQPETFRLGRETLTLGPGITTGIYSPQRSVIDAFRLRHREGSDLAIEATRQWLRKPGNHPGQLLDLAAAFPSVLPVLRTTLEVLLE